MQDLNMTDAVDLTLLATLTRQTLDEVRELRREVSDVRRLALLTSDFTRRLDGRINDFDRRLAEMRDDVELMLKSELMGSFAHLETRLERSIDKLGERVTALEAHRA